MNSRRCRVVIASSGVGHVLRGYEIFATSLFNEFRNDYEVKLYKGGGRPEKRECVLPTLRRAWTRGFIGDRRAENLEQVTFAMALVTRVWSEDQSCIIHVSEPWIARILTAAKRRLDYKYTLLFTSGGGASPAFIESFDFIHHNSYKGYKSALEYGIPSSRMFFIPNAINFSWFASQPEKSTLRKMYSIPKGAFVILGVGALNFGEKRIDHLIKEVSQIQPRNIFLIVAGNRGAETGRLETLAEAKLGRRYRFLSVQHEKMPEIYSLADVFVHSALSEGAYPPFAVLEAIASKVPVLVHNNDGFRSVVADEDSLVDMGAPGQLSERIALIMDDQQAAKQRAERLYASASESFDWPRLRHKYLGMYQAIARWVRERAI